MLMDLSCPVENRGTIVKTNSETNEPYLLLKLFNLSEREISAVSFRVLAYDANGTELGSVPVELEELTAEPKSYFAENKAVSLVGMNDAKHFVVQVDKAVFSDGSVYEVSEENIVEVDETSASVDEALLLRTFVDEAICYSAEHDTYWRCVCGRANLPSVGHCVRCGNEKTEMLEKFSSLNALQATIEKTEQEEAQKAAEEAARLAEEKALKIKKMKKALLIALIVVLAAAAVSVAGFFIYKAVLNSSASKAMENGDYYKAYELYQKTGNDKIADVTQHVQGNTPANLMFQSGLITADEENTYYLAFDNSSYSFQLMQENKTTKETKTLTDAAGGSLNVTKDWIYFVDVENGYVKRISKNGETIETIIEKGVSYLSVMGNTIYYIQTDYDNPNNLPEEQCDILVAQGQMETYMHLYQMDVEKRKPQLVTEESMNTCYIHDGRIYYLTEQKDEWKAYNLCSMNLNGEDKQVLVDTPVASFVINEDMLYYVQMYNGQMKGQQIGADGLSYTLVRKNLATGETKNMAESYMPTYLNASEDKLLFIALERDVYLASTNGDTEATPTMALYVMDTNTEEIKPLVTGDVSIFNVMGDDVILYIGTQGMCRVKLDGTGFEEIKVATAEGEEPAAETAEIPAEPVEESAEIAE